MQHASFLNGNDAYSGGNETIRLRHYMHHFLETKAPLVRIDDDRSDGASVLDD